MRKVRERERQEERVCNSAADHHGLNVARMKGEEWSEGERNIGDCVPCLALSLSPPFSVSLSLRLFKATILSPLSHQRPGKQLPESEEKNLERKRKSGSERTARVTC